MNRFEEGRRELAAREPRMATLIERAGPCRMTARHPHGHFAALVRSIVYQQLAGRAASAIHGRFESLLGGRVTSAEVVKRRHASLRRVGLSEAKARSIQDLARRVEDGTVRLSRVARYDDEAVIDQLTCVRGIGRWTAQMFLIAQLGRQDVWPVLDLGVRKGYAITYDLESLPDAAALDPLGERFRPYRSIAAWYFWRATEG